MMIGRTLLVAVGIAFFRGICSAGEESVAAGAWPKESFVKRIGPAEGFSASYVPQVLLDSIFWNGVRLRGNCTYHNTGSFPVAVEGREIESKSPPGADFYPESSLQVSNDVVGEWKTIGTSPSPDRGKAISVSMAPLGGLNELIRSEANRPCLVELDPFRPFIGKFMYGRLLLKNGAQGRIFALDDLLPPTKDSGSR